MESWEYAQFTIMTCYVHRVCTSRSCNTANADAICSVEKTKSDRATKIIVTLLFNDGLQKCKTSFKANEILFGKKILFVSYQVTFIPEKKNQEVGARSF